MHRTGKALIDTPQMMLYCSFAVLAITNEKPDLSLNALFNDFVRFSLNMWEVKIHTNDQFQLFLLTTRARLDNLIFFAEEATNYRLKLSI